MSEPIESKLRAEVAELRADLGRVLAVTTLQRGEALAAPGDSAIVGAVLAMREQRDALELRVAELSSFHDDEKGWRISAEASLASLREAAGAYLEIHGETDVGNIAVHAKRLGDAKRRMAGLLSGAETQPTRAEVEYAAMREVLVTARDALHRDRTGLAAALNKILNAIAARSWLVEERGPYEWDDDRYKDEAGQAMRQVAEIARSALVASGTLAIEAIAGTDTERAIDRALSGNVSAYQERAEARLREAQKLEKAVIDWMRSRPTMTAMGDAEGKLWMIAATLSTGSA